MTTQEIVLLTAVAVAWTAATVYRVQAILARWEELKPGTAGTNPKGLK